MAKKAKWQRKATSWAKKAGGVATAAKNDKWRNENVTSWWRVMYNIERNWRRRKKRASLRRSNINNISLLISIGVASKANGESETGMAKKRSYSAENQRLAINQRKLS